MVSIETVGVGRVGVKITDEMVGVKSDTLTVVVFGSWRFVETVGSDGDGEALPVVSGLTDTKVTEDLEMNCVVNERISVFDVITRVVGTLAVVVKLIVESGTVVDMVVLTITGVVLVCLVVIYKDM